MPLAIKSWSDTKDGSQFPNICMQLGTGFLPSDQKLSEDCLYLNIFVSAKSYMKYKNKNDTVRPILLYIHGGGMTSGYAGSNFDPSILIALSDIIFVSIQYRLGPFGFMYISGSDVSGNQGFLDQNLAIKWVKNIFCLQ